MISRRLLPLLAAVSLLLGAAPDPAASPSDLYARMQGLNPNIASYQADVTVAILTHGPPFISPTLEGTCYFKKPDKSAVIFDTIPFLAQQAKHVVAQLEPPAEWPQLYVVTPLDDNGSTAHFRLVRKKHGRIDHVDVTVDDASATVTGMTYYYKDNGGSIAFTQTYDHVGDDYLIKSQLGKVAIPHYNADVTTTFSNYRLNVAVPASVFDQ